MATREDGARAEASAQEVERELAPVRRHFRRLLNLAIVRRLSRVFEIYNKAGGSLLAEGLAYSALFAGLTGLLLCVGLLGYLVPSPGDRQRIIDSFTGQLAPFAPLARGGLTSVAANASAFSLVGLAGLAWGASHFYGALDMAISRVFDRTPARGGIDRLVRGFVSLLLLVGGLVSGVAISVVQKALSHDIPIGPEGDLARTADLVALPLATAIVVVAAVGIVYRVVPNTQVPVSVVRVPALVVGVVLTLLAELLVYIAPLLTGALSVFGGVATVFAALAWLHIAFQVLLIGASWTRVRLEDRVGRRSV
jgi:membrane protein